MFTAYAGHSAYCYSNSLRMCLRSRGGSHNCAKYLSQRHQRSHEGMREVARAAQQGSPSLSCVLIP
jgi:hypothetical protein